MSRKSEIVESPRMDSPDLIPEGFVGTEGTPGDPWEALKPSEPPENHENQKNPEILEIPLFLPISPKGPGPCPTLSLFIGGVALEGKLHWFTNNEGWIRCRKGQYTTG